MSRLTTHVLDITQGRPAAGVAVELWAVDPASDRRLLLTMVHTNSDGRTAEPLLSGGDFHAGTYELIFFVGDYFKEQGIGASEQPFLDRVPVRFGVSDPAAHYHVPLLVTPWSYSTYRGS
jgi:5-hydroxyisourate hydrolase